jgi:hypothetical protein
MHRIKSVFRSRGVPTPGKTVFSLASKDAWLQKLPANIQPLADIYYQEYEMLGQLRKNTQEMLLV